MFRKPYKEERRLLVQNSEFYCQPFLAGSSPALKLGSHDRTRWRTGR